MKSIGNGILFILLMTCLFSCEVQPVDTRVVKKELAYREIKKVNQGQILGKAQEESDWVLMRLTQEFNHLPDSTRCDLVAYDFLDSLKIVNKTNVYLIDNLSLPEKLSQNPKLESLIEAYRYNYKNQLPLPTNLQLLDSLIVYTQAIDQVKQPFSIKTCGLEEQIDSRLWMVVISKKHLIVRY